MDFTTKLQIDWWSYTQNISKLTTCLQSPSYKIRRLTAERLGQLKRVEAIPFLKQKLNDPVLKVAETVLLAIELIAKENGYLIDLKETKQTLWERKSAIIDQERLADFKFEKENWANMSRKGNANHIPKWLQF